MKDKLYLAPFQGITTYTYREIYTKYFKGIDKLYTPFFVGVQKVSGLEKKSADLRVTHHNGIEVVPQILSKDAEEIIRFANFCNQKGFKEINWNLGCPYPRVANKKRGSGMLPFPNTINDILEKVLPEINIDFSIKCRLGYKDENEIFPVIEVINTHRISELTIHARIAKQLYSGDVNKEVFAEASQKCKVPVVYNGDIFNVDDYNSFNEEFREINRWMIGRGLLEDPFLPAKIKGLHIPEKEEQKEIIYKFITSVYLAYRKKLNDRPQAISVMKELWGSLSKSFENPHKIFNRIKKTKSFEDYEAAVYKAFE